MPQSKPPPLPQSQDEDIEQSRQIVKTLEHNLKRRSRQHVQKQALQKGTRLGFFKKLSKNIFLVDASPLSSLDDLPKLSTRHIILVRIHSTTPVPSSWNKQQHSLKVVELHGTNYVELFSEFSSHLNSLVQDQEPVTVVSDTKNLGGACYLAYIEKFANKSYEDDKELISLPEDSETAELHEAVLTFKNLTKNHLTENNNGSIASDRSDQQSVKSKKKTVLVVCSVVGGMLMLIGLFLLFQFHSNKIVPCS